MHIALPIGTSNMLMANDVPEILGKTNENENRSKIVISAESKEEKQTNYLMGFQSRRTFEGPIGRQSVGLIFWLF